MSPDVKDQTELWKGFLLQASDPIQLILDSWKCELVAAQSLLTQCCSIIVKMLRQATPTESSVWDGKVTNQPTQSESISHKSSIVTDLLLVAWKPEICQWNITDPLELWYGTYVVD